MLCGIAPQKQVEGRCTGTGAGLDVPLQPSALRCQPLPVTQQAGTGQENWFQTGQVCDEDKATAAGDHEHLMASLSSSFHLFLISSASWIQIPVHSFHENKVFSCSISSCLRKISSAKYTPSIILPQAFFPLLTTLPAPELSFHSSLSHVRIFMEPKKDKTKLVHLTLEEVVVVKS